MKNTTVIFVFFICFAMFSCKKEEPGLFPDVSISKPYENQLINVGEKFEVSGIASDIAGISSIQVKLLDEELNNPELLAFEKFHGEESVEFSFECAVLNTNLMSGNYWLRVAVYNEESNHSFEFVRVSLIQEETIFEAAIVATDTYNGNLKYWRFFPPEEPQLMTSLQGDHKMSVISSRHQQLYQVVDDGIEYLQAYNLDNDQVDFKITLSQPFPEFTDIRLEDDYIFVSTANGKVRAFDQFGIEKISTTANQDTFPQRFAVGNQYIVTSCYVRQGGNQVFRNFYRHSGSFAKRKPLDFELVDLFYKEAEEFLVFGNKSGIGSIYRYDAESNHLDKFFETDQAIEKVIRIRDGVFMIRKGQEWFKFLGTSMYLEITFLNDGIENMQYEYLTDNLYVFNGAQLEIFDFTSEEKISTYPFNENVQEIMFLYNK